MTALPSGHDIKILQHNSDSPAWIIRLGGAGAGNDIKVLRCDSTGLAVEDSISIDWATGNVVLTMPDGTVDTAQLAADAVDGTKIEDDAVNSEHIADGAVDSAQIADGAIDPIHLASGFRAVEEDGALTLAPSDRSILLTSSTSGEKAATMTTTGMATGQVIDIYLLSCSDGSYKLAASSLTITLDAAGSGCRIVFDGTAWQILAITGNASVG